MATADFLRPIREDMRLVDDLIRNRLRSDVVLVNQIGEYIIGAGGKRLRPALLLLFAGALAPRGLDRAQAPAKPGPQHTLAAVIEFIHTATLLHDDVVDESTLRRGRSTANAMFGNAASVLVGDFLYSRAFQMMVEVERPRVMQVMADATNAIAEGEVMQLMNCHDPDIDETRYFQVISHKTGKLFEASTRLAALIHGYEPTFEDQVAVCGQRIGTAFQLIDDVLDYSGNSESIGKNLGDDLREGKSTLPLIIAMQRANSGDTQVIRKAIVDGDAEAFPQIVEIIRKTGAISQVAARASDEARKAEAFLQTLPASQYRESLLQLSAFAVQRSA